MIDPLGLRVSQISRNILFYLFIIYLIFVFTAFFPSKQSCLGMSFGAPLTHFFLWSSFLSYQRMLNVCLFLKSCFSVVSGEFLIKTTPNTHVIYNLYAGSLVWKGFLSYEGWNEVVLLVSVIALPLKTPGVQGPHSDKGVLEPVEEQPVLSHFLCSAIPSLTALLPTSQKPSFTFFSIIVLC